MIHLCRRLNTANYKECVDMDFALNRSRRGDGMVRTVNQEELVNSLPACRDVLHLIYENSWTLKCT